jgi:hypothetical protein
MKVRASATVGLAAGWVEAAVCAGVETVKSKLAIASRDGKMVRIVNFMAQKL